MHSLPRLLVRVGVWVRYGIRKGKEERTAGDGGGGFEGVRE